jgi:hypothetical protein
VASPFLASNAASDSGHAITPIVESPNMWIATLSDLPMDFNSVSRQGIRRGSDAFAAIY